MTERLQELAVLIEEATRAIYPATRTVSPSDGQVDVSGPCVVDVHFFRCIVGETFDRERFVELLRACLAEPPDGELNGIFNTITEERAAGGPSYIEWGGWIGSQDIALRLLACGQIAELWTVITPMTLHITGAEANDLAGGGFVMNEGLTWPPVGGVS